MLQMRRSLRALLCHVTILQRRGGPCLSRCGMHRYAAKMEHEGAAMYDAAVALRDAMIELGLACDGGKDSLSMAASAGGEVSQQDPALHTMMTPCPQHQGICALGSGGRDASFLRTGALACGMACIEHCPLSVGSGGGLIRQGGGPCCQRDAIAPCRECIPCGRHALRCGHAVPALRPPDLLHYLLLMLCHAAGVCAGL